MISKATSFTVRLPADITTLFQVASPSSSGARAVEAPGDAQATARASADERTSQIYSVTVYCASVISEMRIRIVLTRLAIPISVLV